MPVLMEPVEWAAAYSVWAQRIVKEDKNDEVNTVERSRLSSNP